VVHVVNADAGQSLHERAVAGDEEAFEALVGPLVEPAIRLAYSMLGDRTEAEDAVQEAVTRAWRKLGQLRTGMPVRPWFLAIVANQCRSERRRRWWSVIRVPDVPQAQADVESHTADIGRELAKLPREDRLALFLYFYLDLPLEEVGSVLGLSAGGAKTRVYRAAKKLRPGLEMD